MFDINIGISIVKNIIDLFRESRFEEPIPAENWANEDLYIEDILNGTSPEQRMRNVRNGKYKITETYPEPYRDPETGKIIIQNTLLWEEDVRQYGAYQASKWVNQGKYNLSPEEYELELERIRKMFERT